jgi:hypothetical protein
MTTPCRDCRKPIPGGNSGGHCARCHESFRGTAAFDNHLARRDDGSGRSDCVHPAWAVDANGRHRPYWQDAKGVWHHGGRRPANSYGAQAHADSYEDVAW